MTRDEWKRIVKAGFWWGTAAWLIAVIAGLLVGVAVDAFRLVVR